MEKINIETDRLILKSISMDHAKEIFSEFTEDITEHMFPSSPKNIKETEDFITTSMSQNAAGTDLQIVIVKKGSNEFVGCGGIHHIDTVTPELGIWVKRSAHGNKYGLEAVAGLKKWADENLDYKYLLYPVVKVNIASRKIAEALGGKVAREMVAKNAEGEKMDEVEYRIPRR